MNWKCSSYTNEGTATYTDDDTAIKQGFNDNTGLAYALAACPTKESVCGHQKYFNFDDTEWTDSAGNVWPKITEADITIAADTM